MIETSLLADCPETIPTLTRWFRAQWPGYYAERTAADMTEDFRSEAKRDGLPVRLVAFIDGELAGTATLREQATYTLPECFPGLGGLFVAEQYRSRGVGSELVRAVMSLAREQGHKKVYATTITARNILEHLGWQQIQPVSHSDEQLLLYRCDLGERGPTPCATIRHGE